MKLIKNKHLLLLFLLFITIVLFPACEKYVDLDMATGVNSNTNANASNEDAEEASGETSLDEAPDDASDQTSGDIIDEPSPDPSTLAQGDEVDDPSADSSNQAQGDAVDEPSGDSSSPTQGDAVDEPSADSSSLTQGDTDKPNKDADNKSSSTKRIVAIDAGHQGKGNYEQEPIGPGSKKTKAKVSSGTQGVATGVPEYKLNLIIAKKVKEELIDRGYEIVMIRESHDVNLSNKERAEIANESGAEIFMRIHADGSVNPEANGASTLYPSKKNPYVSYLHKDSYALSKAVIDAICEKTGAKNRGPIARDDMSGINWCTIPVTIIEMGYMSNKAEDKLMQTEEYQDKIVQGICDGIDEYFKNR